MKTMLYLIALAATLGVPSQVHAATNAPSGHASTPVGAWQKLFADEAWYKGQAEDEQVFADTLEAVKPTVASTLQRPALYKLGDRAIYTGAKQMPALDALAGKKVEICGKVVIMALEGQEIREIWPASVRVAPGESAAK